MKNFFGQDFFRVVFFILLAAFLSVANTGCDWWDDDDDNTSAGGAATAAASTATNTTPAPEAPPSGTASLSGTGIVWKPVSHSDRKLVVLLPKSYSSGTKVSILSSDGKTVIENGRYVGRTNGDRPTYRFSRIGGGYPNGSLLRVGSRTYSVPRTASRYN